MSHEEVLVSAVEKATARGWEFDNLDKWHWSAIKETDTVMNNWYYFLITYQNYEKFIDAERIMYDHDFAKALWPDGYGVSGTVDPRVVSIATAKPLIPLWQRHLMEMVIANDPIKYLGENI